MEFHKYSSMNSEHLLLIESAKNAALEVLLHNSEGAYHGLPRTAGWGYPEPYTRDLMISILGIAVTKNPILIHSIRKVLEMLAKTQSEKGHITSLVHDCEDRGQVIQPRFFSLVSAFSGR